MTNIKLYNGDSLVVLKDLTSDSSDSLITDPPAGISFMNKEWDKPTDFIKDMTEIYKECLRVLKPGASGLVWAIPRTSHWTATALEQSGFEIRDIITHVFGTGFPKSLDISKAIDKFYGAERDIISSKLEHNIKGSGDNSKLHNSRGNRESTIVHITAPSTHEAKQWEGFGTALKPASEHWILIRKPLGESTVAKNVLKHGTGGLNVDESKIGTENLQYISRLTHNKNLNDDNWQKIGTETSQKSVLGRFPTNFVLSHNEDCEDDCTEGCAVKELNTQNEGVSRFFYCAKASKKDRNEGLEGMPEKQSTGGGGGIGDYLNDVNSASGKFGSEKAPAANHHPTVKSTDLMTYLIRLVTPPQGIVLDPFMGSGSTGKAAKRLGMGFIGIEKEKKYFEIADLRIETSRGK